MQVIKLIVIASSILFTSACSSKNQNKETATVSGMETVPEVVKLSEQDLKKYETAYFASGCFWCVEAIFESVRGVKEVISGYSGGTEKNPTYEQVGYGKTTHAEAVEVYYDPKEISFTELVQVFFGSHDPTTLNRQGPDRGAQYRSIAFYKNEKEKKIIESYKKVLEDSKRYDSPIVTEITQFDVFWDAEDYHQDFEKNNPNQSYVKAVSVPRLNRFKKNFPTYLKKSAH